MKVIGDRVLVALPPEVELTTASGLVLVSDPDKFQTPTRGIVVALGEKTDVVGLTDVRAAIDGYLCAEWSAGEGEINMVTLAGDVDVFLSKMAPAPFDVQEGDCVIFPRYAGEEIEQDGVKYVILREHEIIGIVEPKETEAA